jgi:hypothetical protein
VKKYGLLAVHWIIIINFLIEIVYASYVIFVILKPETGGGPLMDAAKTIDLDLMTRRRLYAIECWLAIVGLAIYLALTEIGPRLKAMRRGDHS